MDPKIKEAVGQFLSQQPAKAFETLNGVMEQRTLDLLQAKMSQVGQSMFKENINEYHEVIHGDANHFYGDGRNDHIVQFGHVHSENGKHIAVTSGPGASQRTEHSSKEDAIAHVKKAWEKK